MIRALLILMFIAALLLPTITVSAPWVFVSLSNDELVFDQAGVQSVATATIYATEAQTVTITISGFGLAIEQPERSVFVAPDHPALVNWQLSVDPSEAYPDRAPVRLFMQIDGVWRASGAAYRIWYERPVRVVPRLSFAYLPKVSAP